MANNWNVESFKVIFLENKAPYEKYLFFIFDTFSRDKSPPFCLQYQLHDILCNYEKHDTEYCAAYFKQF